MITNRKIFGNHLDRDVGNIFFDDYADYPSEFDRVAKVGQAPAGNHWTEAELSPLGKLREIPEGGGITFDFPVEGHKKTVYYNKYGLGFQITKEMYTDDLTGNFKKMPSKLAKSAGLKREVEFWSLFNNGFDSETSWDSQYIFDTDHTTLKSGDTIKNEPDTASSLSETSLQAAFEYYDGVGNGLVDEAGNPLNMQPKYLIVPSKLRWTANQLMKNTMNIGSANRDLNTVNASNDMVNPYELIISRWLTSDTAWFLLSDEHDFRFWWKEQAEMSSQDDFYTDSALFKVVMRFACFAMDYKGAYGNEGS